MEAGTTSVEWMHMTDVLKYLTRGGLAVERSSENVDGNQAIEKLIDTLDSRRGSMFTSNYEYPGRYTRWDMGFTDPALDISSWGRRVEITAHNERGLLLVNAVDSALRSMASGNAVDSYEKFDDSIRLEISAHSQSFTEEERSRQPSVFSVLREVIAFFRADEDSFLGLYGAFGYDLAFQFEPITFVHERSPKQRDLVLYLPDELLIVDHKKEYANLYRYDFSWEGSTTKDLARTPSVASPYIGNADVTQSGDHETGGYAGVVRQSKDYFARGDLFEVVPSQVFSEGSPTPPSEIFRRLSARNPSPYGSLINLGEAEYLVGASPEMYVRVEGSRVETCPISGTIKRGADALEDADNIFELLASKKEESELTMCTDVDRNDKSRICEPGSIRIIGRRQIEAYSRLFHTVDHVEGTLLPQFDGLDAFLAHTWAVTVTGAPKLWAMRFIEEHDRSPRKWYGGAIGVLSFNGDVNTGLTLRTIHIQEGVAHIRAGATLLMDSDPQSEEDETQLKASALLDAIRNEKTQLKAPQRSDEKVGEGLKILLVDHEDSFVHTLAGYLRRTGAEVTTVRVPVGEKLDSQLVNQISPDLIVLSPGPGSPSDFNLSTTLSIAQSNNTPVFGVCLGLQGMVEHFGGELDQLSYPMHGKPSVINVKAGTIFEGLPQQFTAGRYHSLFAREETLPKDFEVTAQTDDGLIMAIEHKTLPMAAVQFHPESLMTLREQVGIRMIENVIKKLRK